jgi:capsule biosynthesis phosphatase
MGEEAEFLSNLKPNNIVVPLGGVGRRFSECGYQKPKPLIRALGKELIFWVLDSLKTLPEDEVYLPYNEQLDRHGFQRAINTKYPNIKTLPIPMTRGAAETVKMCVDHFGISGRLAVLDGDTWYEEDILALARGDGNMIAYFESTKPEPIYSYIETRGDKVVRIREKEKISDKANSGCYVFRDASRFSEVVSSMNLDEPGEAYISKAIDQMIGLGEEFRATKVSEFHVLGTPEQVIEFSRARNGDQRRFCFDLDNTLVTAPRTPGDYSTVEPIQETINHLRGLKQRGHTIIIYTARRMRTHSGNMGKVLADVGRVTMDTLEKFDIPYDEIHFGKPYAHFYVDDLMVDPRSELSKETGFYVEEVRPRHFNKVEAGKTFRKTSSDAKRLRGEIHYHHWIRDNCPQEIRNLFPRMISSSDGLLETEAIRGLNFSTMYVNEILREETLDTLMSHLSSLHSIEEEGPIRLSYENFSPKMMARLAMYDHESMGLSTADARRLGDDLDGIATEGFKRVMIHGDPVFSNILLDVDNKIKMVDMRGAEGEEITVFGHPLYDFAKVYQSLCGYDEVLLDKEVKPSYRWRMRKFFEEKFDEATIKKIKKITASLFFSLVPLHEDEQKKARYLELAKELV